MEPRRVDLLVRFLGRPHTRRGAVALTAAAAAGLASRRRGAPGPSAAAPNDVRVAGVCGQRRRCCAGSRCVAGRCLAPNGTAKDGTIVKVRGFRFEPAAVPVPVDGKVTWIDYDGADHTVTASDPGEPPSTWDRAFDRSPVAGRPLTISFAAAGSVAYLCRTHPHLTGRLAVG